MGSDSLRPHAGTPAPRCKELQTKYKNNPAEAQPGDGGILQEGRLQPDVGLPAASSSNFPIFIAMYNLFNNHFDLRGAMFIPGWIPGPVGSARGDIHASTRSEPGSSVKVRCDAGPLPIIYLVSQLLYGKYTSG